MRKNNWENIFRRSELVFPHFPHTLFKKGMSRGGKEFSFCRHPPSFSNSSTYPHFPNRKLIRSSLISKPRAGGPSERRMGRRPIVYLVAFEIFWGARKKKRGGGLGGPASRHERDGMKFDKYLLQLATCLLCTCAQQYVILKPFQIHSISSHQWKVSESFTGVF